MKFWEAMKALQEGKKVKYSKWDYGFIQLNEYGVIVDECKAHIEWAVILNISEEWEIVEEPEFYWQWICISDHALNEGRIVQYLKKEKDVINRSYVKFAGPWVKTEEGFKKHETWEQF